MGCPNADQLRRFTDGTLSSAQMQETQKHVDGCPACFQLTADKSAAARGQQPHSTVVQGRRARPPHSGSARSRIANAETETQIPRSSEVDQLERQTMIDHFQIMRRLGRGGMGTVYLARDTQLGRKIALKLVHPELLGSSDAVERFMFEARTTAKFNHPNIVTVFAVGKVNDIPYVALEYLEGQDLRQRLNDSELSLNESLRIILAVAEGICEAHKHGVLHRDLKPANILLPKDGRIRVVDFGLAHQTGSTKTAANALNEVADARVTDGQSVHGTPAYMAPEQWQGRHCSEGTDIWALGLILYELCTGRLPYTVPSSSNGETVEPLNSLIDQVCSDAPVPRLDSLEALPEPVRELIAHCLEKEAEKRPNATQVVDALREIVFEERRSFSSEEESPFRGLLPFAERHADVFFGRRQEIGMLVERLRNAPSLAIVGASGAGKSSLIQAGLLPRLREQASWFVVRFRPGQHPIQRLARHLLAAAEGKTEDSLLESGSAPALPNSARNRRSAAIKELAEQLREQPSLLGLRLREIAQTYSTNVLLLIDQLEEVFTLNSDPEKQSAFLKAVCTAADDTADPVRMVLTVRSDFLPPLAEAGEEARATLEHMVVLNSPQQEARAEILTAPLEAVGYRYDDPELVQQMAAEVDGEGCLPLLQFAARQLWELRDRSTCTLRRKDYEAMGGVAGALARHADTVIQGLSAKELEASRIILMRLVTPQHTRRIMQRQELLDGLDPEAKTALDRLTSSRLLTINQTTDAGASHATLELAHESLVKSWSKLARWLEESHDDVIFLHEVKQAAALWKARGRRPEELWQKEALHDASSKLARLTGQVPELVSEFIAAGSASEQRRRNARRLAVVGAISLLSLIAVVLALQNRHANQQRQRAEAREAEAQRERALALVEGARSSLARRDMLEARAMLRLALETSDHALTAARGLWHSLSNEALLWNRGINGIGYDLSYSPDGSQVAVACQDKSVYLFDPRSAQLRVLRGHKDQVRSVDFSPDGKRVVSGSADGELRFWNPINGALLKRLTPPSAKGNGSWSVRYSPDGKWIASGNHGGTVQLIDAQSEAPSQLIVTDHKRAISLAFSPDSKTLAAGAHNGLVKLWDIARSRLTLFAEKRPFGITEISFSPTGDQLALVGTSGTVELWDTRQQTLIKAFTQSSLKGPRTSLAFSPDGNFLAVVGHGGTIRLWNLRTSTMQFETTVDNTGSSSTAVLEPVALRFSPDNKNLLLTTMKSGVSLWRVDRLGLPPIERGHRAAIYGLSPSLNGKHLASSDLRQRNIIWDTQSGKQIARIADRGGRHNEIRALPGQRWLHATSRSITTRDEQSGAYLDRFSIPATLSGDYFNILLSPDRKRVFLVGDYIREFEIATGLAIPPRSPAAKLDRTDCELHPRDGQTLACVLKDTIRLESLRSGQEQQRLTGHTNIIVSLNFNHNGEWLASAARDKTVRLWNLRSDSKKTFTFPCRPYWLSFHPHDNRIGVPCSNNRAYILNEEGRILTEVVGHAGEVNIVRFSPDGKLFYTGSDDNTVRSWHTKTGHPYWRGPIMLSSPPQLFTHQGWQKLHADGRKTPLTTKNERWRQSVSDEARYAESNPDQTLLCMQTHDQQIKLWDLGSDQQKVSFRQSDLQQIIASSDRCIIRSRTGLFHIGPSGERKSYPLTGPATTVSHMEGHTVVATKNDLSLFDHQPQLIQKYSFDPGVTAIYYDQRSAPHSFIIGFGNGMLEHRSIKGEKLSTPHSFEETAASSVVRIKPGPPGTVVAGFADGVVGIWNVNNGQRLLRSKLHGRIQHLLIEEQVLYAATDLGDFHAWDLSTFYLDHCSLLREVWQQVPTTWQHGRTTLLAPPNEHRCAAP